MKNFILFVLIVVGLVSATLTKPTDLNANTVIGINESPVAKTKFVVLQQTGLMKIEQKNCLIFSVATIHLGTSTYTAIGLPFVGKYLLIDAVDEKSNLRHSLI